VTLCSIIILLLDQSNAILQSKSDRIKIINTSEEIQCLHECLFDSKMKHANSNYCGLFLRTSILGYILNMKKFIV